MAKFQMGVTLDPYHLNDTARVDDSTGSQPLAKEDNGKFVKLKGDSRYGLCAAGDKIEGVLQVADDLVATFDGYRLGSISKKDLGARVEVTLDGLEATPGTGTVAVGDYVVCGTVVARGTALSAGPKVCKATNQPGATVTSADNVIGNLNAAIAKIVDQLAVAKCGWKVVAILGGGTGAVGDKAVIERV
jgi:hypothetical protein